MAITDIYGTIRTLTLLGGNKSPLNIAGDIWAFAGRGEDYDGWVYTVEITSSGGGIGTISPIIDSLEFEDGTSVLSQCKLLNVSGDVYILAYTSYMGGSTYNGTVVTFEIDSSGQMPATIIDSWVFSSDSNDIDMVKSSDGIFALTDDGGGLNPRVFTIAVDNAGNITKSLAGEVALQAGACNGTHIFKCAGAIVAACYNGKISTHSIDGSGNIGTEIATVPFTSYAVDSRSVNLSGDVYGIVYEDASSDGWIETVNINIAGAIALIDSWEFEAADGNFPDICHIISVNYAIVFKGSGASAGWVITVAVSDVGTITKSILSSNNYITANAYGYEPFVRLISSADAGLLLAGGYNLGGSRSDIYTIGIGDHPVFTPKIMVI